MAAARGALAELASPEATTRESREHSLREDVLWPVRAAEASAEMAPPATAACPQTHCEKTSFGSWPPPPLPPICFSPSSP